MDDVIKLLADLGKVLGGGLITWLVTNWKPRQIREDAHDEAQNKTIEVQGRTLEDAWKKIEYQQKTINQLEKEMNELRSELRKYTNAYARSVRFIHEKLPDIDIPNFMETDPRLNKVAKSK